MLALRRILHPTDFSPEAEAALDQALLLARLHGAALYLLHVVALAPEVWLYRADEAAAEAERAARQRLDALLQEHSGDRVRIEAAVRRGEHVGQAILEYAAARDADIVVMGTHGRDGLDRWALGSVAEAVARHAVTPVLTVRPPAEPAEARPWRRLLVPVDLSERSEAALRHAAALAREARARVEVLHVIDYRPLASLYGTVGVATPGAVPDIEADIEERLRAIARRLRSSDVRATASVKHGPTAATILDRAKRTDADLIVMASHGRSGLKRFFLGSVAEKVLRQAPCPVFLLKSFGRSLLGPGEEDAAGPAQRLADA